MLKHYDVVIIGSGAGGGTLAHYLSQNSDKKILILERGDYLPREKDNWRSQAVFVEEKYHTSETWIDKDGKEFRPGAFYGVGGNTKLYGAALMRLRETDFGEVRHQGGTSPAWPIDYKDLKPYYRQAEELYNVHGLRGEDPYEPPDENPFKYPPVAHEPRIEKLSDDLKEKGLKPFHLPLGLRLDESDWHKSPCIKCSTCDGFPCLVDAKADAQVIAVDPSLEKSHVTLIRNSYVHKLATDESGKTLTGVHVLHGEEETVYTGDIVVVSCGAANSAALLLRSANEKHPNGLANSSDVVGRHYMCHNNSALMALSTHPNPTKFQKTLALTDFYYGSDDYDYPMGLIQMLGKSDADMLKGDAPGFTPHKVLDEMATHSIDFWLTTEDLPDPENRVTVDNEGKIHLSYSENNVESHQKLVKKLEDLLEHIGCERKLFRNNLYLGKKIPIAGVAHQCGTVRFGTDPKTSALDINCKAHDLDNLYVVDAGFFPSASAVNPSLTIIANSLRVGSRILERLQAKSSAGSPS
jgi:choline dehydrogenase-like flavoprotein